MKKLKTLFIAGLTVSAAATTVQAKEFSVEVPMRDKGASTFYVKGQIEGLEQTEFMVDTGAGYTTINEHTLEALRKDDKAVYVKDLVGILADGSRMVVPVYRISSMKIGETCEVQDVDAAVFSGRTRQILGLSALKKTSPFIFSTEPAKLTLSNCGSTANLAAAEKADAK